ncbi:MAG TPA: DEAD/DEAH box helicase, partial [Roseiarcus sp.]|nr:DEAD/DEAH box helicase [Roseiarcus sp.]
KAVESSGYDTPTPIQEQAIPYALAGRDVLGIAQTGTGKTAAFTLPMLSRLEQGRARARMPRTLILEPTRELAAQVEESFVKYGVNHKLSVALLIGGVSFGDQETKITRGADVLIATPGRLLDFVDRGKLLLTGIEILVIDEADRMLDMGFIPDIERICKLVPFTRQTLFFSATMPPEITRLVDTFLQNPARVEVARAATTAETIVQALVHSGSSPEEKRATLRGLVRHAENFKNAIIFCNRKRDVAVVYRSLQKHGFSVGALHGDMDQRSRTAALDSFRNDEVQLLVCSDVAARGLDIPDVSHVINYDTPHHAEDYVHRIGRTGRAGKQGAALTIVARADTRAIDDIEKLINRKIDWAAGGATSVEEEEAAPREERGDSRRGRGRSGERGHGRSRRPPREPRVGAAQAGARHEPRENPDLREPGEPRERQESRKHREPTEHREPRERHEASAHREPRERHEAHNPPSQGPRERHEAQARPSHEQRERHESQGRPSHEPRERHESQVRPSHEQRERHESQGRPSHEPRQRHESQGRPSREQRERGGHRSHPRRQDNDRPIVGLGDHVPSFLLRPVRVAPPKVEVEADE